MQIDVLTLLPEVFPPYLNASIIGRSRAKGLVEIDIHNIRDFAEGKHRVTDEPPFGGGGGMILKPEPLFAALEHLTNLIPGTINSESGAGSTAVPIILLSPQGKKFDQERARQMAKEERIILICGRYEGVDERVRKHLATEELSIGDYVITGGELAAMVIIDSLTRLQPGAIGAVGASDTDSHSTGTLEGPHYTRPASFRGWDVPDVLRSGHAAKIARWRREESLRRTWARRPELLLEAVLEEDDKFFLARLAEEQVSDPLKKSANDPNSES